MGKLSLAVASSGSPAQEGRRRADSSVIGVAASGGVVRRERLARANHRALEGAWLGVVLLTCEDTDPAAPWDPGHAETTGYKRNRRFVFGPYLKLFESEKALTTAQLERIAAVQATFAEFDGGAHEEWVREFAQDGDPEAEIVAYEEMAKPFTLFCSRRDLAPGARHEVFLILLLRSAASEEETLRQLEGKLVHLGVADVQQVLSDYTAPPQPIGVIVR